jgi:hypothetical protein
MSCYAEITERQGAGATVPAPRDGSVWLLGNNAERGNILFRRGPWDISAFAEPLFSLCNAWMDIHNSVAGRRDPTAVEKLSFAVDIFPDPVPSLDALNRMYQRDVGKKNPPGIKAVRYSPQGEIVGFVPE